MSYDDRTLHAFLEGTLPEREEAALQAAIEQDARLAERLVALDPMTSVVEGAFQHIPSDARLKGFLPEAPRGRTPVVPVAAAAAVAGAIALSLVAFSRPSTAQWHEQVAAYQALYVPETIARLSATDAELNAQFQRASDALGRDVSPQAVEIEGLTLRRAQVLGFKGAPLIQIVYSNAAGQPIALCIMEDGGTTPPRSQTLAGLASATWSKDGVGFILIGGDDESLLSEHAVTLSTSLSL